MMSNLNKYSKQAQASEGSPPKEPSDIKANDASAINKSSVNEASPTGDAGNFLKSFLKATPFFDLFEYVAERSYKGKDTETKIAKLRLAQPNFYNLCIGADSFTRIIVVVIVIYVATRGAIKLIS